MTSTNLEPAWPRDVIACLGAMRPHLESAGIEWFTPWWWERITEFYASGKRQMTARVGRRGRKSYSWCIVGVAEILTQRHAIPPGDTGVVAVVSADLYQANDRLSTFRAVLEACGMREKVDFKQTARGIDFVNLPYRVQTLAASVSAVSSYTCIMAIGDEVAKWRDGDAETSIGAKVLESWRSTMRTMPAAKMILISSPVGEDDPHAKAFALGNTDRQTAVYAPTWIANPAVTEAYCRADCETEEEFLQEHAAIPQALQRGGITPAQVDRATRAEFERTPDMVFVAVLYACLQSHRWLLTITTRKRGKGSLVRTVVAFAKAWDASTAPSEVLTQVRTALRRYRLDAAYMPSDTPSFAARIASTMEMRPEYPLALVSTKITDDMHASLALRFGDDGIELPPLKDLRADLLAVRRTAGSYDARGFAVCLALAAAKTVEGPAERVKRHIPGSPEWHQELAAEEMRRDYELMRERNDSRDRGFGDDWLQTLRGGAAPFVDAGDDLT